MSKRHKAVFDAVLDGLPEDGLETKSQTTPDRSDKSGTRFLKRSSALADRSRGEREEKTLRWVNPAECRMWGYHNRAYSLLTEDNCRDLIDGIRAQGRQEFPAIVRQTGNPAQPYEVICGARRHFAISWLQANNYPQFKYLIDIRDLTDEEAFRLADIENRERQDISDFERARDYDRAIDLYYGGKQKTMAARLEVSEAWLSRYLQLARLPKAIVDAFYQITDLKESHARTLKPLLAQRGGRDALFARAAEIEEKQLLARQGQGAPLDAGQVMAALKEAVTKPKPRKTETVYRARAGAAPMKVRRSGRKVSIEFPGSMEQGDLEKAWGKFLKDYFAK